jgi:hypothetical protein
MRSTSQQRIRLELSNCGSKGANGGEIVFAEVKRKGEEGKRQWSQKNYQEQEQGSGGQERKQERRRCLRVWSKKQAAAIAARIHFLCTSGPEAILDCDLSSRRHQELRGADKGK